jgi:Holliday junction DNA helicase RuvB
MEGNIREDIRPGVLDEFVGQSDIVRQVKVALASARTRKDSFPHTIMSGPPGLGKTTLAEIISGEMGVEPICVLASSIKDEQDLDHLLGRLPYDGYGPKGVVEDESKIKFGVLFIDEIHQMNKKLMESMHTALEDYVVTLRKYHNGKIQPARYWIPKFTMIGATNYLGRLPKPFIDRFLLQLTFQTYVDEELIRVLKFSSGKYGMVLTNEACARIASNARGIPRVANRFLCKARDTSIYLGGDGKNIDLKCVDEMFEINRVDSLGLVELDRKVLRYLMRMDRPVGIETIAHGVDEDEDTIENYVEPWLMKLGLMARTGSGRVITEEGIARMGNEKEQRRGLKPM